MAERAGNGSVLGVHEGHAKSGEFDGIQFEYPDQKDTMGMMSGNIYDEEHKLQLVAAMCIGLSLGLSMESGSASFGEDGSIRLPDGLDLSELLEKAEETGVRYERDALRESNTNGVVSAQRRVPLPASCWGYSGYAKAACCKRSSVNCVPSNDSGRRA